ncbi:type I restriction enzyme, S subunit [Halopseudomonas litoralis]|uniref:Type I restriction enzyme, S subunit n=1 Tax=Halopseudomonas litoralis TaxID=797277 RepID=A0A1H1VGY4_9GAMM|nr:restriction endonuclease subunit S [Halopseudomonas litoralis]SDS83566.1 type I restriction enzyme, S subunit [Halopseudomonas litoralis]
MSETLYEQRPLGDAVERHIGGGTPPRQVPSYWKGEIPWASVKDFPEQKGVIQDTEEHISSAGLHASASNLIPAQTPLVCTRMAVGRAALPVIPMAINQDVKALFPASGVSAEYLLKLIQYIQPLAEGRAVGSTVKGIRIQDYLNIPVPLAPQAAQPVIAQILDTLDTAIRETEALIDKLKAVKQGLLHDLLSRGIDASGELRPPQSEAPQLYKESPLGWIPREWEVEPIINLTSNSVIGPFGSDLVAADYRDSGVPVIFVRDVKPDQFVWKSNVFVSASKAQALAAHEVRAGDVVATKMGFPPCVAAVYPESMPSGIVTADIVRLRPCTDRICPDWMSMFINSSAVAKQVEQITAGVTRPKVTLRDVRNLLIGLPPFKEQERVLDRLTAMQSRIQLEETSREKLTAKKAGLMDDLLTGRVRVTPLLESVQQPAAQTGA